MSVIKLQQDKCSFPSFIHDCPVQSYLENNVFFLEDDSSSSKLQSIKAQFPPQLKNRNIAFVIINGGSGMTFLRAPNLFLMYSSNASCLHLAVRIQV